MEKPDDIIGHKTFDTGERGALGLPIYRHEPLTRAEGEALLQAAVAREKARAEEMPDDKAALHQMFEGYQRLKELGWKDAIYAPKDGTEIDVIEAGSTVIHKVAWRSFGHAPLDSCGCFFSAEEGWRSRPILFRLPQE